MVPAFSESSGLSVAHASCSRSKLARQLSGVGRFLSDESTLVVKYDVSVDDADDDQELENKIDELKACQVSTAAKAEAEGTGPTLLETYSLALASSVQAQPAFREIAVTDVSVQVDEVQEEMKDIIYRWDFKEFETDSEDWFKVCSCAEKRSRGADCKRYEQQGENLIFLGASSAENCVGDEPEQHQTCPCPDAKGLFYQYEDLSWADQGGPFAEWSKNCSCGESRQTERVCSLFSGNADNKLQSGIQDSGKCDFSMTMMSPDFETGSTLVDILPDTMEVCPCNDENFADPEVTKTAIVDPPTSAASSTAAVAAATIFTSVFAVVLFH
jgi:hypothetical protein